MYAHLGPPLVRLMADRLGVKVPVGMDVRTDVRCLWAVLDPGSNGVCGHSLWGGGIGHGRRRERGGMC